MTPPEKQPRQRGESEAAALVEQLQRTAGNAAVGGLLAESRASPGATRTGDPVPPPLRESAERKLGSDLGDVRVHSDLAAEAYASSHRAEAVTIGQDVFLGSETDLVSGRGQKTLLHELVHAVQSMNASTSSASARGGTSLAGAEHEARQISSAGLGGAVLSPAQPAPVGAAQRKSLDDEQPADDQASPQPGPTAQELLNPPESEDESAQGPKPGTSGENESVVFEVTIMEPLRGVMQAVEDQDWEKANDILQTIGFRLMDYQNAYEKSDPLLYRTLMSARGWMGMFYAQLNRRLDKDLWSDDQMTKFYRDEVLAEFQSIEGLLH